MMQTTIRTFAFLLVSLATAACGQSSEIPTRVVIATLPKSATSTTLDNPTMTPDPTPVPTDTPTLPPTNTPVVATLTATPSAGPGVNITSPRAGGEVSMGDIISVGGLVQLDANHVLSITLSSATGHLLAEELAEVSDVNSWQVELAVPELVSGPADLRATVREPAGFIAATDSQPIFITLDPDEEDRYLSLFRPNNSDAGVAGYHVFFDGIASRPVNGRIAISLWSEGCTLRVARQAYTLRGSGYWQGFVIVPRDEVGSICAVADFGQTGEEGWREAQVVINILAPNDDAAYGVLIGNPREGGVVEAGRSLLLYGTAHNAPERLVNISILLENGRVLTEGLATADLFGYWELDLFIPADAEGPAQITATIGVPGEEDSAQYKSSILIE